MPVLAGSLNEHGAVVDLLVGVHEERRAMLQKHGMPVPPRTRIPAQLDPGSSFSAIAPQILRDLGIDPIYDVLVRIPSTSDAPQTFRQTPVSLVLDCPRGEMHLPLVMVIESFFAPDEGIQAMLGRDVLEHCLLVYDGIHRTFTLAF
jgi:hypothetical protein